MIKRNEVEDDCLLEKKPIWLACFRTNISLRTIVCYASASRMHFPDESTHTQQGFKNIECIGSKIPNQNASSCNNVFPRSSFREFVALLRLTRLVWKIHKASFRIQPITMYRNVTDASLTRREVIQLVMGWHGEGHCTAGSGALADGRVRSGRRTIVGLYGGGVGLNLVSHRR